MFSTEPILATASQSVIARQSQLAQTERRLVSIPTDAFVPPQHHAGGPTVLDLFAGAGGFSLGFSVAGAQVTAAIELDKWACETLAANHPNTDVVQADISQLTDATLVDIGRDANIIIGGPPCQGFSIANRRAGDPTDPRNSLFQEFVRAIGLVKPDAFVLENVPGLLNRRAISGKPVIEIIVEALSALGYDVHHQILESQAYGVPQLRPRLFVVGYRQAAVDIPFPARTHGPAHAVTDLFNGCSLPFVTLWEAISDLPDIEARQGREEMEYTTGPLNDYQMLMRGRSTKLFNNVAMNHSARMVERFSHVKWGESGMHVPIEHQTRKRGNYAVLSGKGYSQNNRRMHPNKPCHTVPASFYANFIHPFKHRNFTPREGARIQSFPDWYRFSGKPTVVSTRLLSREERCDELHLCQYNQIGNAVPPLVAFHLARHIISNLSRS